MKTKLKFQVAFKALTLSVIFCGADPAFASAILDKAAASQAIVSKTYTSVGAGSVVNGGALTGDASAGASVAAAQASLSQMGPGTALGTTMTTDTTLQAGIYSAASFATTAGTTLNLDGQGLANQVWNFNITDNLTTGASTRIVMTNLGANSSVIWNTGGYTSLGASSTFIGTILANTYISVGADAIATGAGTSCGGLYSASSYVSTGAGSIIGSQGCTGAASALRESTAPIVPSRPSAPEIDGASLPMRGFLLGTLMLWYYPRRRNAAQKCLTQLTA